MGLPDGRTSFKIGLAVLIQYRRVMVSQPPSHVAVASTLYAYLRRAVKTHPVFACYYMERESILQSKWAVNISITASTISTSCHIYPGSTSQKICRWLTSTPA